MNSFQIIFLKDRLEFINEMAGLMFGQWGHLRPGAVVDRYRNALSSRLNQTAIPLTILAVSPGNVLLGFASLVEFDMDTHPEFSPWISGVFVKQEHRKIGIGRRLVKKIEEIAAGMHFQKLYLFTYDRRAFYSCMLWEVVQEDNYLNSVVTIMNKSVIPSPADHEGV